MTMRRIIAVTGATGAQGGGLARAILSDPRGQFTVRALTRKPESPAAQALARAGAEVVQANLDDEASVRAAFAGAYGAFCVTNFWEHFSPGREFEQAATMARAAAASGVAHVIWSTLEDTRRWVPLADDRMPTLMGSYKVPHFDAKGEADGVFRKLNVPTTFLLTSFYWENLIYFGMAPRQHSDGSLSFMLPMGDRKLPGIAVDDIGRCVLAILARGGELIGATVGIAGEHLTGAEMAAAMTRALGREVRHVALPHQTYRELGFPGAEDVGNMFQFNHDFADVFCGVRDVAVSRSLNPGLQTFEQWLAVNRERIPIA